MKIGVFGGSFDPIHIGHLIIAEEARWQCRLDTVLFVVTAHPPHKKEPRVDAETRFEMVRLALDGQPDFRPSRIEIDRGGSSYTEETLKELRCEYGNVPFYLIVGGDSVLDFSAWKNPEAVIGMTRIVVLPRPGFDLSQMDPRIQGKVWVLEGPSIELSSTILRKRLREGKSIRFLVPEGVEKFIRERALYLK
jgi:nicotinate-nucleotide adenylyltransferase